MSYFCYFPSSCNLIALDRFLNHLNALKKIPGAEVLIGGDLQKNHKIPACYGSFMPTAVKVNRVNILLLFVILQFFLLVDHFSDLDSIETIIKR